MKRQMVIVARPPIFEDCVRKFGRAVVDRPGVIFSWGMKIYAPGNATITRELFAHEAVHGERQLGGKTPSRYSPGAWKEEEDSIWAWWKRYLDEPLFRLDEELHAHHAEYHAYRKRHGHSTRYLTEIAARLAGPLYGNLVTVAQAKHAILTGVVERNPTAPARGPLHSMNQARQELAGVETGLASA